MHLLVVIYVGSLLITSVFSQYGNYTYLGCYLDQGQRKLRGEYLLHVYQSQEMCLNYCKRWNYTYAGLQDGNKCFCGDDDPQDIDKRPESQCNTNCPGRQGQKCGGLWRNAIYSTGEVPPPYAYVGCYLDELNRKLKGYNVHISEMSPRVCINHCAALKFQYAGLERTECFCGNTVPDNVYRRTESECNIPCSLDWKNKCGASLRLSIYNTLIQDALVYQLTNYHYMGCYRDSGERRLRGERVNFPYMTQEMCLSYCKKRKFPYAGAQNGNTCFCGSQTPVSFDKKPETECNSKCPGEQGTICGDYLRNSIYYTGEESLQFQYRGCYLDESNRKLFGFYKSLGHMTERSCIDRCRNMLCQYAGLQYGHSCFCGDTDPLEVDKRPEGDCSITCPGDYVRKCGGPLRNSVYHTRLDLGVPAINPVP